VGFEEIARRMGCSGFYTKKIFEGVHLPAKISPPIVRIKKNTN
jgi:hypothetical protein